MPNCRASLPMTFDCSPRHVERLDHLRRLAQVIPHALGLIWILGNVARWASTALTFSATSASACRAL